MPDDPILKEWHARGMFPWMFPRPALIYFFHQFANEDIALLRRKTHKELIAKLRNAPNIQRDILALADQQPIFKDVHFLHAWDRAFWDLPDCTAGCLKIRFYCMVVDERGRIVTESANRRMTEQFGEARFCTETNCIRDSIQSRTDQAVGDCGHAPLWCLSQLWQRGYSPTDLSLFRFHEAGFYVPDFRPWIKEDLSYTCLQCQNEFAIFGLTKIYSVKYVKGIAQWTELPTAQNFYNTAAYAKGEKKA